ncbi:hypothetical protein EBZ35_08050 [bacterium]|nr:hypothetical protein [bacterium]
MLSSNVQGRGEGVGSLGQVPSWSNAKPFPTGAGLIVSAGDVGDAGGDVGVIGLGLIGSITAPLDTGSWGCRIDK